MAALGVRIYADHLSLRDQPYISTMIGTLYQIHLQVNWCADRNFKRAKRTQSAGADVYCAELVKIGFAVACNSQYPQWQLQVRTRIDAPFVRDAYRVRGNSVYPARFNPGSRNRRCATDIRGRDNFRSRKKRGCD